MRNVRLLLYLTSLAWGGVKNSCRDMDDWSQALLSCKLSMIGVNAGEVIKQQGAPSDYAYILLGGAAKVRNYSAARCLP
jgi:CRP-like cAMP-binding protein